jgi:hypothetical protein
MGGDNSADQMGMYCRDGKQRTGLVLYMLHGHSYIQCDLLIPIFEPAGRPVEAVKNVADFQAMNKPDVCLQTCPRSN